jgi:hypothetical protein
MCCLLQEDERLAELVKLHGSKKWSQISADLATGKGSKQVRRNVASLQHSKALTVLLKLD